VQSYCSSRISMSNVFTRHANIFPLSAAEPVQHAAHVLTDKERGPTAALLPGLYRPRADSIAVLGGPMRGKKSAVLLQNTSTKVLDPARRPRVLSHTPQSVSRPARRQQPERSNTGSRDAPPHGAATIR
jgi:hypothetical protein